MRMARRESRRGSRVKIDQPCLPAIGAQGGRSYTKRGRTMRVHHRGTLGALLAAGIMLVSSAAPVGAQTTVNEQYDGTIVTSGASGTRTVLASVIRMRGVFNGVGHIVELPNLPNDPPTVSRDDLVFAQGTIHFIGFFGDVLSFTFN